MSNNEQKAQNEVATTVAEREAQVLSDWEEAGLGLPHIWIKQTPKGRISQVKALIPLSEKQKEIVPIDRDAPPMITADGYYKMNQIGSLAVITPDSIRIPADDGSGETRSVANPYPVIDLESGTQKGVWTKKMTVGYSPIGSLVVTSTTIYYDFTMYFLADLQRKVQFNKDAGRLCFEHQLTEEEKNNGIFLKIEGPLGIWANMQHTEVLKAVNTWLANKHFGERKAQTVAERNAMKRHPALSGKPGMVSGARGQLTARVQVIGWQHDHDWRDLAEIAERADAGEDITFDGQPVEYTQEHAEISDEDIIASDDADIDSITPGDSNDGGDDGTNAGRLF